MQSVKWLTFCISNSLTRTIVHFFPSCSGIAATGSVNCKLSIFGDGGPTRSVNIEGARLSQPDGVRLEDAFPTLREGAGTLLGLEIELCSNVPRMDLSGSTCVIELESQGEATRFWPVRMVNEGSSNGNILKIGLALKDTYQKSSVVVVNGGGSEVDTNIRAALKQVVTEHIPAVTVREVPLSDTLFDETTANGCSWGDFCSLPVLMEIPHGSEAACFMLYRDCTTRRALSVSAL